MQTRVYVYMGEHAITLHKSPASAAGPGEASFDALFEAHHSRVLKAAYRVTGNLQDAEDVLQSVFLRLLKSRDDLGVRDNPGAYLSRAAVNAGIDLLRRRQRQQTETLIENMHEAEGSGAESTVRQEELQRLIRAGLLSLEPRTAEVFALRYLEGYSNAEIAELLDATPNNIGVTLHRARAYLQDFFGELEGEGQ